MSRHLLSILLLFGFVVGCGCTPNENASNIVVESPAPADDLERRQESLDRNLTLLNSLEEYPPSLPEMPGAEKLIQASDRLNKWIVERPADPKWKADDSLQTLEKTTKRCEEAAREVVRLLRVLQGNEGESLPKSLDDERKQVAVRLTELDAELKAFGKLCEITDFETFSKRINDLQKKFSNLESIPNLTAAGIRAFAKQLETERNQFENVAEELENLAAEFRIDGLFIQPPDVDYLKQCTWMRNIAHWARGDKQTTLDRVRALFDWTVRNIEIRDNVIALNQQQAISLPKQFPWQSLLIGKCTAWDRAWVFMELLRQERVDSCILSIPHPVDPTTTLGWAIGVLIDNEIYLFLPFHGLPVPGPGGLVLKENGDLDCQDVATFAQVLKDDALLRRLDLGDKEKFPVTSETAAKSTVHLLVTPFSVSLRMKTLEAELNGEQSMVLYGDINEQRRLFRSIPNIEKVELWMYPFKTMFEQLFSAGMTNELMGMFRFPNLKKSGSELGLHESNYGLWSGRILYFKGKITGQHSAVIEFQDTQVPDRDMLEYRQLPMFQANRALEPMYQMISLNATYWLGIASFEADWEDAAKDYFESRKLKGRNPWTVGVQYMLGRVAERNKNYGEAIDHYSRYVDGPAGIGNQLRAQWLQELTVKK